VQVGAAHAGACDVERDLARLDGPLRALDEIHVPVAGSELGEPDHASSGRSVLRAMRKPRWTSSTEPSKRRSSCSIETRCRSRPRTARR
jgi:hypothetical protein